MNVTIMQTISQERLALYAEHDKLAKLCQANPNDRDAGSKCDEVWRKLVKSPTVLHHASDFVKDSEGNVIEQVIHIEWRE